MLVMSSMAEAEFYKMVHEVAEAPEEWEGKTLQIHGFVEAGSIKEEIVDSKPVRTFIIEEKGARFLVHSEGPAPDTFRDLSEVVAKGQLVKTASGEYEFKATELMAKCPSKYKGNERTSDYGQPTAELPNTNASGGR